MPKSQRKITLAESINEALVLSMKKNKNVNLMNNAKISDFKTLNNNFISIKSTKGIFFFLLLKIKYFLKHIDKKNTILKILLKLKKF